MGGGAKRHISLIVVREGKDKDKAGAKSPYLQGTQLEAKVTALASVLFGCPTVVVSNPLLTLPASVSLVTGVVCAVELPLLVLRDVSTCVQTIADPSGGTSSSGGSGGGSGVAAGGSRALEALFERLSPVHSKRYLKLVLNALANIPVLSSPTATATAGSVASRGTGAANTPAPLVTAFLFSILDEKFDMCAFSPSVLRSLLS